MGGDFLKYKDSKDRDNVSDTQVECEQPQVTLLRAASAQLGYNFFFLIRKLSR